MSSPLRRKDTSEKHKKAPQLRIARGAYGRLLLKKILSIIVITFACVFVLYICFAATIVRFVPTTSGAGIVLIKNPTYDGGIVPVGEVVLVDTQDVQQKSIVGHLKQAFVPNGSAAKVSVVAGPYGKIDWAEPGVLTVDGEIINAPMPSRDGKSPIGDTEYLNDQYVGICLEGNCIKGEAIIIESSHIMGVPLDKDSKN